MHLGLFLIRLGLGLVLALVHGGPDLFGGMEEWTRTGMLMNTLFGFETGLTLIGFLIVMTEFLGGICMLLGLFFRPCLLLLILTIFLQTMAHLFQGISFWSLTHSIEMGVVFIGLFVTGPGRLSLDRVLDGVLESD